MIIGRHANESDAYRSLRDRLLAAEIALRDQREAVAELRRQLPLDTALPDYRFRTGSAKLEAESPATDLRLSELISNPDKPLVVCQFMYGGAQTEPCPTCSLWVDGYNGISRHLGQRFEFAVVAQAGIDSLRALARERGWHDLRLLSSEGSSFKADLGFEDADGQQFPGLSVIVRGADGGPVHFYSVSAVLGEGEFRGVDIFSPLWHLLDATPAGRGDWWPGLTYVEEPATRSA